jgi:hypothetical protein
MPVFRLSARVTVSAYTSIEADTLEAAIEAAEARPVEFSGGGYSRNEHWLIDEPDGSAQHIIADED